MRSFTIIGTDAFASLADEWEELAMLRPSPFHTHAWLSAWWGAYGRGDPSVAVLRTASGRLEAGAMLRRTRDGGLTSAANDHSGDWGAVAADEDRRAELWRHVAGLRAPTLTLTALRDADEVEAARAALTECGRRLHDRAGVQSPYLELPGSFDELLASRSANLRSQLGRRRRALERLGELRMRTVVDAGDVEAAFAGFVAVEGSGWKSDAGTALEADGRAAELYRHFADAAARRGWLRLHLLELDGEVLAADLGCVMGDQAFLMKTGYAPEHADRSPGLVLRGLVLRHLVEEEGVRGYDLLGGPDGYKLRWTEELRPRTTVHGFSGVLGSASELWFSAVRPVLADTARRLRDRRPSGSA